MENAEKIVVAVVVFAITSVIAYLFRMRQLYVVAPKLYRHSSVSTEGSICELVVYNKGNYAEESIQVGLDPEIKCELLASNLTGVSLKDHTIEIDRLHKGSEASLILLVDNGILDFNKIVSASSKNVKGSIRRKVTDVPPNYAMMALGFTALLSLFPGIIYGERAYKYAKNEWVTSQLKAINDQGWRNLNRYYGSDLQQSYSNQEFPIRYVGMSSDGDIVNLKYELYNKTAAPLKIAAKSKSEHSDNDPLALRRLSTVEVPPMSKQTMEIAVFIPVAEVGNAKIDFSLTSGEEFIYGISHSVKVLAASKGSKSVPKKPIPH